MTKTTSSGFKQKKKIKQIRSVAIYCHNKPNKEKVETIFIRDLVRFFYAQGIKVIHGDLRSVALLKNSISRIDDEAPYDLKIGIGGDGTLLKMIRTVQKNDGLLLGINFGTLGFLSELTPKNAIEGLKKVMKGQYIEDERLILKTFVHRKNTNGVVEKIFRAYALNEIVFGHGGLARLTNFNVKVDRRFLSTYRSDGLIFSTPTGSTAYSMSAGGPIVSPALNATIVTPVSPHTLTHRPILLPAEKKINLDFDSRVDSISLTVDGQIHFSLRSTDQVSIQKATRTARFIRMGEAHYFKSLRSKLGWGN